VTFAARNSGDGTLAATTALTYTDLGAVSTVDPPLSATNNQTRIRYDAAGRIDGVAWGATALVVRTGLLGSNAQQQAISTNARLGTVVDQIASHPWQTASAVGAVASKYPLQMVSRMGSGAAVSIGFTPSVGVAVSSLSLYGSAFEAAYQHPDAVAVAAIVGEMCP
jgi:hypothetical protein